MAASETLDAEVELIASSLLPEENLSSPSLTWPREIVIANAESQRSLQITIAEEYPKRQAVTVEVKGNDIGRDAAAEWSKRINGFLDSWEDLEDFPLYQLATTHLLPLLAPETAPPAPKIAAPPPLPPIPHHALLTSHHLLSSTKRKNFLALSSQLSLVGFSKVGHPGIYYAVGDKDDLEEWVREVKSWNWLALRVRVGVEPIPDAEVELEGRGKESGARGGKGRGDWVELEKIGDALEWLKKRGREQVLLDIGIGGSSE